MDWAAASDTAARRCTGGRHCLAGGFGPRAVQLPVVGERGDDFRGLLDLLLLPPTTAPACVLRHRPRLSDEVDIGGAPDVPLEHGDELGQDVAVDTDPPRDVASGA